MSCCLPSDPRSPRDVRRETFVFVKGGGLPVTYDAALLVLAEEQQLVREIARFPLATLDAAEANEPSFVSRYLLDLAAAFSRWYTLGN